MLDRHVNREHARLLCWYLLLFIEDRHVDTQQYMGRKQVASPVYVFTYLPVSTRAA